MAPDSGGLDECARWCAILDSMGQEPDTRGRWWAEGDWDTEGIRLALMGCQPTWPGDRRGLYPVVAEHDVAGFEARQEISLPIDYRAFITQVGAGGAGPGYGLFAFDRSDLADALEGTDWISFAERSTFYGTAHRHTAAWVFDLDFNDIESVRKESRDQMTGTWMLADHGCASWDYLIVTGEACGQVWNADGLDNAPVHDSFSGWYGSWLDRLIAAQLEPVEMWAGRTNLGTVDAWFAHLIGGEIQARGRTHQFPVIRPRHGRFEIVRIDGWDETSRRAFLAMLGAIADDLGAAPDPAEARLRPSHSIIAASELVGAMAAALS